MHVCDGFPITPNKQGSGQHLDVSQFSPNSATIYQSIRLHSLKGQSLKIAPFTIFRSQLLLCFYGGFSIKSGSTKSLVIGNWFKFQSHSLTQGSGGWDWKFKPSLTGLVLLATSPHLEELTKGDLINISSGVVEKGFLWISRYLYYSTT